MTAIDTHLGREVHMRMWERGIPQRDLADRLGIGQSTLSKKLRGTVTWSVFELVEAADFLGVSPPELLPEKWAPWGSNPQPTDYGFPVPRLTLVREAA